MTDHATTHARTATVTRDTAETRIHIDLNLDGTGKLDVQTGVPFFEHMLDQVARHGQLDLAIQCDGDIEIDDHHTVEDIGIALGQAFREALGDKRGIQRYGHAYVPLDEALSRVVIDFSGRSGLYMNADFTRATVGRFDTQLVSEFFNGFVGHAAATLHIDNLKGDNAHHQVETIFKAFGRAVRQAVSHDERMAGRIASTKGTL
ncbi:imidazoleglycerol-phosphate dehydratase HisB [Carnimonas bestiolae]|uniref:imidazoleglycerol-phosphate dehydratase HisB n=1 Tax=Carnimonas bestiolae TaxID=3402172 RepID=UPI003EDC7986